MNLGKLLEECPKREGRKRHCYHDESVSFTRKVDRCCFCGETRVFIRDPDTGALSPRDEHGSFAP